ncbi:hypothetical protein H0E87_031530, partial [Populus deltoides]
EGAASNNHISWPSPEIPTIDLNDPNPENLVRLIADASKEWGIFQVVNHGIPSDLIAKLQDVGKKFLNSLKKRKRCMLSLMIQRALKGMDRNCRIIP